MQAVYWYVEFEVLTAVDMKWSIFWDIKLCGPLKVISMKVGGRLDSCLAYSLTVKMEMMFFHNFG
jgi:hypothetical protein